MNSDLLSFLSMYCHEPFRDFLQKSFNKSDGIDLTDDNLVKFQGTRYDWDSLKKWIRINIYNRILAHYKSNHCSALNIPNAYELEFERLLNIARVEVLLQRGEIDDSLGKELINLFMDNSFEYLSDSFRKDVAKGLRPNSALEFTIFSKLKELLKEEISIDELEFYSGESQDALLQWKEKVEQQSKSKDGLCDLSTKAIFYLFDNGNINAHKLVSYFLGYDNLSWENQLNPLITRLLSEEKNYKDLFLLLERGKGVFGIVIENDSDILNPFIPFLRGKGRLKLKKRLPKEVNWLLEKQVIDSDTASAYYIKAQNPEWADIKLLISRLLNDNAQYDNLWNVLNHFDSKWLSSKLEDIDEYNWPAFLRYLRDEKKIDLDMQSPIVVNRLQELGIIDLNDAILYYEKRNIEWPDISPLVSCLLKDKAQYDNLWKVLNHFNSRWLSTELESIKKDPEWQKFLGYLLIGKKIILEEQSPRVVSFLGMKGLISTQSVVKFLQNEKSINWSDISDIIPIYLDSNRYDDLTRLLNKCGSDGYPRLFESFDYSALKKYLIHIKNYGLNIIEAKYWDNVDNEKRELFLRTILDNLEGGHEAAREPLKKYFKAYEEDVSLDLYCYLFTQKDYYFREVLDSFENFVRKLNKEEVDKVKGLAVDTDAWRYAMNRINNIYAPNWY